MYKPPYLVAKITWDLMFAILWNFQNCDRRGKIKWYKLRHRTENHWQIFDVLQVAPRCPRVIWKSQLVNPVPSLHIEIPQGQTWHITRYSHQFCVDIPSTDHTLAVMSPPFVTVTLLMVEDSAGLVGTALSQDRPWVNEEFYQVCSTSRIFSAMSQYWHS